MPRFPIHKESKVDIDEGMAYQNLVAEVTFR